MIVADEHVAAVRALVTGDDEALGRLVDGADDGEDWELAFTEFESLLKAAREEVNRRLPREGEKVRTLTRK